MAFLKNKAINRLNIVLGCVRAFDAVMLIFGPLFLYNLGLPVSYVFFLYGGMSFLQLITRFAAIPLINRFGLKSSMLLGTAGYGISVILLSQVTGIDTSLFTYIIIFTLFNNIHWLCYHVLYLLAGDREHRGKQYAIGTIAGILASAIMPIIGGYIITGHSYFIYTLSAIPITLLAFSAIAPCKMPTIQTVQTRDFLKEFSIFNISLYTAIANGFFINLFRCSWVFIIYFAVGDFITFGWLIAFGIAAKALIQLFIGHKNDQGAGRHINNAAFFFLILGVISACALPLTVPVIIGIEFILALGMLKADTLISVIIYNDGATRKKPFWYIFTSEIGWDIGNGLGFLTPAILLLFGIPLKLILPFSLIGAAFFWMLVQRYHKGSAAMIQPV